MNRRKYFIFFASTVFHSQNRKVVCVNTFIVNEISVRSKTYSSLSHEMHVRDPVIETSFILGLEILCIAVSFSIDLLLKRERERAKEREIV